MKEVKFMILALMAAGLFVFTSCDDDVDINPDQVYHEALSVKYPAARNVEWEKKGNYHVADCYVENKDLEVWFNESAKWTMTETELTRNDLPTEVTTAFDESEYATWRIDDVDMLQYESGKTLYVIEVEQANKEIDLYFSTTGELVETKDVTNSDDTHWPE